MTAETTEPMASSATAAVLEELQLYGYRAFADEPDPRPLPEADALQGAIADIFEALAATLEDTRLEPDLEDLLWSLTNLFHRTAALARTSHGSRSRAPRAVLGAHYRERSSQSCRAHANPAQLFFKFFRSFRN